MNISIYFFPISYNKYYRSNIIKYEVTYSEALISSNLISHPMITYDNKHNNTFKRKKTIQYKQICLLTCMIPVLKFKFNGVSIELLM